MSDRLRFLTLATATLLFSVAGPAFPFRLMLRTEAVQAQTVEDRKTQADRVLEEGFDRYRENQFEDALNQFEEALLIYREIGDREAEAEALGRLGDTYRLDKLFEQAINFYRQFVAVREQIGDTEKEAWAWARLGNTYVEAGQYKQGIESFQAALTLQTERGDRLGQAQVLSFLGWAYLSAGQEEQSVDFLRRSLAIYQEIVERETDREQLRLLEASLDSIGQDIFQDIFSFVPQTELKSDFYAMTLALDRKLGDREKEAQSLYNLGNSYFDREQYEQAIDFHQQYLALHRELYGLEQEEMVLPSLLFRYSQAGQFDRGLDFYQSYLTFVRESGNRSKEARILSELGSAALDADRSDRAMELYQQSLTIYRELGDLQSQLYPLRGLGDLSVKLQEYDRALELYQQFIAIAKQVYDRQSAADFLNGHMARMFWQAQQFDRIIPIRKQALSIYRELGDRESEAYVLRLLGDTYRQLDRNEQALDAYQQSLAIFQAVGNSPEERLRQRNGEVLALQALGDTQIELKQYAIALDFYRQAVAIYRELGDRDRERLALQQIGDTYLALGQSESALEFHQQYLALVQTADDRIQEIFTLNELGTSYQEQQQYDRAFAFYQNALNLGYDLQQQPDFASFDLVGTTLGKIGSLLAAQHKSELAIVFYKSAINAFEKIRADYSGTDLVSQSEFASVFLSKHEAEYRALADLLLQQNRILEAQRVLDLLKVEELDNYFHDVRGNNTTAGGVPNLAAEQQIEGGYQAIVDRAVAMGRELTQLRQKNNRSPEEEQRLLELMKAQEAIVADFNTFIASDEVETLISQLTPETRKPDLVDDLEDFLSIQDNLKALQQNAVILYPLILDDRLELVLTTPDSPPIRRTVNVSKEQLTETILAFRRASSSPRGDAQTPARQLYQWLIEPIENDLKAADAETIIYAPDGQLRYISLAALYDGDRWLVERYRINHITATSLTDLDSQPPADLKILAGAFTTGQYRVTVGTDLFEFDGLPFAGVEVETLAKTIPNTTQVFDAAFNPEEIKPKMGEHTVLHFATHGAISIGTPEESFILFGDGTPVTIAEVRNWNLNHIDLVVLSACETGLGGNLGTGAEILGLGYQMQRAGARAAIASLWAVDDGGTQVLMNGFYEGLNGGMAKAEALRQAQIDLITGDYTAVGGEGRSQTSRFAHPYYWAPFILIGNGL
jgi:CHAT domain-containing protein